MVRRGCSRLVDDAVVQSCKEASGFILLGSSSISDVSILPTSRRRCRSALLDRLRCRLSSFVVVLAASSFGAFWEFWTTNEDRR